MFDALPMDFHLSHVLESLEVNYLAEAVYGHGIEVCADETEPGRFVHTLKADRTELFRAASVWKSI